MSITAIPRTSTERDQTSINVLLINQRAGRAVLDEGLAMDAGTWLFISIIAIIALVLPSTTKDCETSMAGTAGLRPITKMWIAAMRAMTVKMAKTLMTTSAA